jgi:hypothetical protein
MAAMSADGRRVQIPRDVPAAHALATVDESARHFGVSVRAFRAWLEAGAPQAARGRRGRGGAALFDLQAVAAWRETKREEAAAAATLMRLLAADIPEILELVIVAAHRSIEGPHKAAMGPLLAGLWYAGASALRDRIASDVPGIPEIKPPLPLQIAQLLHIKRD